MFFNFSKCPVRKKISYFCAIAVTIIYLDNFLYKKGEVTIHSCGTREHLLLWYSQKKISCILRKKEIMTSPRTEPQVAPSSCYWWVVQAAPSSQPSKLDTCRWNGETPGPDRWATLMIPSSNSALFRSVPLQANQGIGRFPHSFKGFFFQYSCFIHLFLGKKLSLLGTEHELNRFAAHSLLCMKEIILFENTQHPPHLLRHPPFFHLTHWFAQNRILKLFKKLTLITSPIKRRQFLANTTGTSAHLYEIKT